MARAIDRKQFMGIEFGSYNFLSKGAIGKMSAIVALSGLIAFLNLVPPVWV